MSPAYLTLFKDVWARSKIYRGILIATGIYAAFRLIAHLLTLSDFFYPDDLRIYLEAAEAFRQHNVLYPTLPLEAMEFFQYAPSFALAFVPFTWLGRIPAAILHSAIHIVIYVLMYLSWDRIFGHLGQKRAQEMLIWTLPVWLVFSAFWSDMAFLNVYMMMALLATLLIEAIFCERLWLSVLWLSIILQIKPQWAFAALIPLLLGRYRFFFSLIGLSIAAYITVIGLTGLIAGPYGFEQYRAYLHLMTNISGTYPWRGPSEPFLGYNHSIVQIFVYLFGITPRVLLVARIAKLAMLIPLAIVCLRLFLKQVGRAEDALPQVGLDVAFALYTGAFIWLDVVWEMSLGIALFTYLLATPERRSIKALIWIVFLPYALVDFFQLVSYGLLGDDAFVGAYLIGDPSIYLPLVMIAIAFTHYLLVSRLWVKIPHVAEHPLTPQKQVAASQ